MDKLEVKRNKSLGRERKVKERAKGWEDVNDDGVKVGRKKGRKEVDVGLEDAGGWVDEDMDEVDVGAGVDAVVQDGEVKGDGQQVDVAVEKSTVMSVGDDELL